MPERIDRQRDLFTPEIRSTIKVRSVSKTEAYDDTKVAAMLREIAGKDHTGVHVVGCRRSLA